MSGPTCPRCRRRAFSTWRKLTIGPLKRVPCESCGVALSVAPLSSVVLIVLASFAGVLGGIVALTAISGSFTLGVPLAVYVIGGVAATVPFMWLYAQFVPLVARDA